MLPRAEEVTHRPRPQTVVGIRRSHQVMEADLRSLPTMAINPRLAQSPAIQGQNLQTAREELAHPTVKAAQTHRTATGLISRKAISHPKPDPMAINLPSLVLTVMACSRQTRRLMAHLRQDRMEAMARLRAMGVLAHRTIMEATVPHRATVAPVHPRAMETMIRLRLMEVEVHRRVMEATAHLRITAATVNQIQAELAKKPLRRARKAMERPIPRT